MEKASRVFFLGLIGAWLVVVVVGVVAICPGGKPRQGCGRRAQYKLHLWWLNLEGMKIWLGMVVGGPADAT